VCVLGSHDGAREPRGRMPSTLWKMSRLFTS